MPAQGCIHVLYMTPKDKLTRRPVLLNVPKQLLQRVDRASRQAQRTRTNYINYVLDSATRGLSMTNSKDGKALSTDGAPTLPAAGRVFGQSPVPRTPSTTRADAASERTTSHKRQPP